MTKLTGKWNVNSANQEAVIIQRTKGKAGKGASGAVMIEVAGTSNSVSVFRDLGTARLEHYINLTPGQTVVLYNDITEGMVVKSEAKGVTASGTFEFIPAYYSSPKTNKS